MRQICQSLTMRDAASTPPIESWLLRQPPFRENAPTSIYFRVEHMPRHATYPSLTHAWGEFVYSYEGVTELRAEGKTFIAPQQSGLWIPPGVTHTGLNYQESVHCSMYIDRRLCSRFGPQTCALQISPMIREMLEYLRRTPPGDAPDRRARRLLAVLVDFLSASPQIDTFLPSSQDPVLARLLRALQDDPSDDRTVAQLARDFNISERTLMRRCHDDLGMPLGEWKQRMRVIAALPLLESEQSVESVALALGYSTSSAFISMYKRLTGTTPKRKGV